MKKTVKRKTVKRVVRKKVGVKKVRAKRVKDMRPGTIKSLKKDNARSAKLLGKRKSKNNKTYYEYRKNRSDLAGKTY